MPAIEIEVERAQQEAPKAERRPEFVDDALRRKPQDDRFSPDPSKSTDRYRLVTPYELPAID